MLENIILKANVLKKIQAACGPKTRAIISGVYIEDTPEGRFYVATNGTTLVVYNDTSAEGSQLQNPIVLRLSGKIKELSPFSLRVIEERQVILVNKMEIVPGELIEGRFPGYRALLPKNFERAKNYSFVSPRDLALAAKFVNINDIPSDTGKALYWKEELWEVLVQKKNQNSGSEKKNF